MILLCLLWWFILLCLLWWFYYVCCNFSIMFVVMIPLCLLWWYILICNKIYKISNLVWFKNDDYWLNDFINELNEAIKSQVLCFWVHKLDSWMIMAWSFNMLPYRTNWLLVSMLYSHRQILISINTRRTIGKIYASFLTSLLLKRWIACESILNGTVIHWLKPTNHLLGSENHLILMKRHIFC